MLNMLHATYESCTMYSKALKRLFRHFQYPCPLCPCFWPTPSVDVHPIRRFFFIHMMGIIHETTDTKRPTKTFVGCTVGSGYREF